MNTLEFKQRLFTVLHRYLQHKYSNNTFVIALNQDEYFVLNNDAVSSATSWAVKPGQAESVFPPLLKHQPILVELINLIAHEKQGYKLYRTLQQVLKETYPTGLIFSSRMPLYESLRQVLKKTSLAELNQSDVNTLKQLIEALTRKIKLLLEQLTTSQTRCEVLEREIHTLEARNQELEIKAAERDNLEQQLALSQEEARSLLTRLEHEEKTAQEFQASASSKEQKINALSDDVEQLLEKSNELLATIEAQKKIIAQSKANKTPSALVNASMYQKTCTTKSKARMRNLFSFN